MYRRGCAFPGNLFSENNLPFIDGGDGGARQPFSRRLDVIEEKDMGTSSPPPLFHDSRRAHFRQNGHEINRDSSTAQAANRDVDQSMPMYIAFI
jgi:hypothetical protein